MLSRARTLVAPCYLFACLLLGGSAQGIWANMLLQLGGVALIAWAAAHQPEEPLSPAARQLLWLAAIAIAVVALQLVPLPPAIWSHLPGRARIASGYSTLGMAVPWEPVSLAPAATLNSLLGLIPPLALFCALVRLKAYRPVFLALALLAGTIAGIALAAVQVASSGADPTSWYLYPESSFSRGVGFFANADHMGTLLVIAIPFVAAMIAAARNSSKQRYLAVVTVSFGTAILLLVGIALNGSLAAYGLAVPVAVASLLLFIAPTSRLRPLLIAAAGLLVVAAFLSIESGSIGASKIGQHAASAAGSRAVILKTSAKAIGDLMPLGSGFGSFRAVYPLYEQIASVDAIYVVHAHNDYAELIFEFGLVGVLLILAFLAWWAACVWRLWRSAEPKLFSRAATIASAAMLVHSLADFPLRTAAIACCFAMCLALMADSRAAAPEQKKALRRNRHVEFR